MLLWHSAIACNVQSCGYSRFKVVHLYIYMLSGLAKPVLMALLQIWPLVNVPRVLHISASFPLVHVVAPDKPCCLHRDLTTQAAVTTSQLKRLNKEDIGFFIFFTLNDNDDTTKLMT